jgi:hypothetical protein
MLSVGPKPNYELTRGVSVRYVGVSTTKEAHVSKTFLIWLIVKAYFIAALAGSFTHIITAAERLGLHGWEATIVPFLIDGMFLIAIVLRSEVYSTRTRRIALRVQVAMGVLSLTANITAATTSGGIILAVLLISGMIFSEWLADPKQMKTAATEQAEQAVAEAEQIARDAEADAAARKAAGIAKGVATRAAKRAEKLAETKVLENMLKR